MKIPDSADWASSVELGNVIGSDARALRYARHRLVQAASDTGTSATGSGGRRGWRRRAGHVCLAKEAPGTRRTPERGGRGEAEPRPEGPVDARWRKADTQAFICRSSCKEAADVYGRGARVTCRPLPAESRSITARATWRRAPHSSWDTRSPNARPEPA